MQAKVKGGIEVKRSVAASSHSGAKTHTYASEKEAAPFWHAPWEFAVHVIVGTSIFSTIAAPAVGLDLAIGELEQHQISTSIIYALKAGEYALLGTDLWLFGVFLFKTAKRATRAL